MTGKVGHFGCETPVAFKRVDDGTMIVRYDAPRLESQTVKRCGCCVEARSLEVVAPRHGELAQTGGSLQHRDEDALGEFKGIEAMELKCCQPRNRAAVRHEQLFQRHTLRLRRLPLPTQQ